MKQFCWIPTTRFHGEIWKIILLLSSKEPWENLFIPYANNKGADQPAHLHRLISTFVIRCLDSIISLVSISKIASRQLATVAEQACLSLTWLQTPKIGFLLTRLKYPPYLFHCWLNFAGEREGGASYRERGTETETEGEDVAEPLEENEENSHVYEDPQSQRC